MDALKQQLLKIQQQLAGLSASQKMLTASLVAIMVMTLLFWSRYSGSAEQVSLIDQQLSADDMAGVKGALDAKRIPYELKGDKIMVAPDAKFGILADLSYDQSLPHDMKTAFDDMIAKMTPLDAQSKTEQFYNHAREQTLKQIISRWPGVKSATVIINNIQKTSILNPMQPSASVDITMKPGEQGSQKLAKAARLCVSGAQSGLDPQKVSVLINGQSVEFADPDNAMAGDNFILKNQSLWEDHFSKNILNLMHIQGLYATVSVDMTTSTSEIEQRTIDPKQKLVMAKRETTSSEDSSTGVQSNEPGAVPNTGLSTDSGPAAPQQTQHREQTETENVVDSGYTKEIRRAPAGNAVAVRASVRVPESYFIKAWKVKNPSANRDPTDAEIEALVQRQTKQIRDGVKAATNIKDDDAIAVASYIDVDSVMQPTEPAAAGLATLPMTVGFGAKEIAIGALALISLFMVSMMVRKSAPQLQIATVGSTPMPLSSALEMIPVSSAEVASEVSESGAMLTGHELSEEAIEAKNVIEQVDAMVKSNPEAAAALIKRWINAD